MALYRYPPAPRRRHPLRTFLAALCFLAAPFKEQLLISALIGRRRKRRASAWHIPRW